MTLAGEGKEPGRPHMLRLAEGAGVSKRAAAAIIDEVRAAVARWRDHADRAGVAAASSSRISGSFPRLAR